MSTPTVEKKTKTQELLERQRDFLFPIQSKMLLYGDEPLAVEARQRPVALGR